MFMATKITINPNGSIRVEGDFTIQDAAGKEFGLAGRTVIGLCRCGHRAAGFASVCEARDLPPPAAR